MSAYKRHATSILYGSFIVIVTTLAIVFSSYAAGMFTLTMIFFAFGAIIAWIIQSRIDRKVSQQPTRQLTGTELQHFKIIRAVIIVGVAGFILFQILFTGKN